MALILSFTATTSVQSKDVAGRQDYPLVSRYGGSKIVDYDPRDYDWYRLYRLISKIEKTSEYGVKLDESNSRLLGGPTHDLVYRNGRVPRSDKNIRQGYSDDEK